MLVGLGLSLVAAVLVSCSMGAVPVAPLDVLRVVGRRAGLDVGADIPAQQAAVVWSIRLPRVALAALVGGGLAVSGAVLQGVFRNPLAEPGIIGVSAGAAVGAVGVIMAGWATFGTATVPLAAFAGGLRSVRPGRSDRGRAAGRLPGPPRPPPGPGPGRTW